MTLPVFSEDVPQINRSIKAGGIAINDNNRALNALYRLDHIALDEPDGNIRGKHRKITLVAPLDEAPAPSEGQGVIYTNVLTGDDPLPQPTFMGEDEFARVLWAVSEERGDCSPKQPGFIKLPCRLMIVWGNGSVGQNTSTSFLTVPFVKPFKTIFSVQVNFIKASSSSKGIVDVWTCNINPQGFAIRNTDSFVYGFQYLAIGLY